GRRLAGVHRTRTESVGRAMNSQFESLIRYLAADDGPETRLLRAELDDDASDASRVLTASRELSRAVFSEVALRRLGLAHAAGGMAVPPAPSPRSGGTLPIVVPWVLFVAATVAAVLLAWDCPRHRQRLLGTFTGGARADVAPLQQPKDVTQQRSVP